MKKPLNQHFIYWAPFLIWTALTFVLLTKTVDIEPDTLSWLPEHTDKAVHFFIFGVLAWLLPAPLRKIHDWRVRPALWAGFLISSIYGLSLEGVQAMLPYRNASIYDAVANMLGAATVFVQMRWNQLSWPIRDHS